jgi:hypothetical protein
MDIALHAVLKLMVANIAQIPHFVNRVNIVDTKLIIPIAVIVLIIVIVAPMAQRAQLVILIIIYLHQTNYVKHVPLNVRPALSKLIQIVLTAIQTESTLQIAISVYQDIPNMILQFIIVKVVHKIVRFVLRILFVLNVFHPSFGTLQILNAKNVT